MSEKKEDEDLTAFQDYLVNGEINCAKRYLPLNGKNWQIWSEDGQLSPITTALIPNDVTAEVDNSQLVGLSTTGNGDCLFNASSIMLFGDESVSTLLRLLVAGELYFNSSFYAAHEAFTEMSRSNPELYPDVLFTVALTKRGDRKFTETGDRDEAVKEEALLVC